MKFHLETKLSSGALKHVDIVFVPVWKGAKGTAYQFGVLFGQCSNADQKLISSFLSDRDIKLGESHLLRLNDRPGYAFLAIEERFTEQKLAIAFRRFVRRAKYDGFKTAMLSVDDFAKDDISALRTARLVSENALLAQYDFSEQFKMAPTGGWRSIDSVIVHTSSGDKEVKEALREGETIAECVNECRTLANYPPSDLKPEGMAEAARDVGRSYSTVKVTVFDEKKLKQEGMNAILAVGQGSASAPRLIVLEYLGNKKAGKKIDIALVGKGVTFDSGGLNLKPGDHMADMHMDMSGGAAVIYGIKAIAALKLPVNIIGLVPAVENMPSGLSYRQGDIIKAYGGKTIEIGNTDAEGRVILADAIEYAKTKKPAVIVEISTLTGAAEVALGQRVAALFVKNNKNLSDILQEFGERSGDRIWPLPLWDEHEKDVEGNLADVINTHKNGSRWGGAISGAAFLSIFAGTTPFAHIDMAPRMLTLPEEEQLSRGAAGFGVRLFVELARKSSDLLKTLN